MIRFEGVGLSFRETPVLRKLDLAVREGELLVVLGASGSGKTTMLKLVNRLLEPTSGRVLVGGAPVDSQPVVTLRRSIGYVFQRFGLFPHMTVAENIGIAPWLSGWGREKIARRVDDLLEMLALDPAAFRSRYPRTLSGGQQQRVALARALALTPRTMLLDEPFGALDPMTRDALETEYERLHADLGLTTMMVTHDMTEALRMADRIAVLSSGELVRLGTPGELLAEPGHHVVEALLSAPVRQVEALEALRGAGRG